jgi:alpha-glucosidase
VPQTPDDLPWWESAVLYQIYPRSFADSDGDGIGDLRGVIDHLDHLAWLGVDGIWLSPITMSPNADWGYDVSDYCDVQPEYGSLADLDELIATSAGMGIRVLLDLVPNHTSDGHPWFVEARRDRRDPRRSWYVWADGGPEGEPPNNWVSTFGGPAWTYHGETGQWYLHNFLPEQPDLNWWNPAVADAFDDILRFWWARGVAGFRIDVCNMIVKDALLRDNPPATEEDPWIMQMFGQRPIYNSDRPEVHDVIRRWRRISDGYEPTRLLLGETNVDKLETLASFYGEGDDELHLGFNFPFVEAPFEAEALREVVEGTEALLPPGGWPVWTGSNHDVSRLATRWCGGDPAKVRAALFILLTLRGTPVLYQGDEIGLTDGAIERDQVVDPVGLRFWPAYRGRDPERTPMPWSTGPGAGFTDPGAVPWLPLSAPGVAPVSAQRDDDTSVLHLVRGLIALRRATPSLRSGSYVSLPAPPGVWSWRRGDDVTVAVNLTALDQPVRGDGPVVYSTHDMATATTEPVLSPLRPWEGVVLRG